MLNLTSFLKGKLYIYHYHYHHHHNRRCHHRLGFSACFLCRCCQRPDRLMPRTVGRIFGSSCASTSSLSYILLSLPTCCSHCHLQCCYNHLYDNNALKPTHSALKVINLNVTPENLSTCKLQ